jgi:site-specific DNA-cytosine methylase
MPSNHDASRVVDIDGIAPTVKENHGTVTAIAEPFIVASRGRNPENTSDRTSGAPTEQRLEPNFSGYTNTITSVQKDNYVAEPIVCEERRDEGIRLFKDDCVGTLRTIDACGDKRVIEPTEVKWRIRKLTPKCCWRLMNFSDADCDRAAQYVSASALYKQAGNSIIVSCLVALMSSLFIEDGHKAEVWTKYMLNYNN